MTLKDPSKNKWFTIFLEDFRIIGGIYVLLVLVASVTQYFPDPYLIQGVVTTHYNNYLIFKQSFIHFMEGRNLYVPYPTEHLDLYKYSPTFAVLFAPLAYLPDLLGLSLWNALNAGLLFCAISYLPFLEQKIKIIILWFIAQELLTSLQNSQSNGLMAGLIVTSFLCFEKKNIAMAALCLALGFYIKIFALVGAALFLLYPGKFKFLLFLFFWIVILFMVPLLIASPGQLAEQYQNWFAMLSEDHSVSEGYSVIAWLRSWFGIEWNKYLIVLGGIVIFCLPYLRREHYTDRTFRTLWLCSILLWIVIFNHKAESPTFVIAMTGVGIWYFIQKRSTINLVLVVLAFIFTSLSPTDMFPAWLFDNLVRPYVLKGFFCIVIWFKIIYELLAVRHYASRTYEPE